MLDLTRRSVLAGSALLMAGTLSATSALPGQGLSGFRGVAQRGRIPRSYGFGKNWAQGARVRHVLPVPFRRIKVVMPTFCVKSLSDVDFETAINVQAAIEYPYSAAIEDIPERRPATFSGVNGRGNTGHYDPAKGPFAAITTDVIDLGVTVPAGTPFGSWVSLELAGRQSEGLRRLPISNIVGSSIYRTWEAVVTGNTSYADEYWCRTASSLARGFLGPTESFVPLLMVDCGPNTTSWLIVGDSITAGIGEGVGGTGTKGDARGDADGNSGWAERWLARSDVPFVNFSKASQRLSNMADPEKSRRQRTLAGIMGCTDILVTLGTNDIFKRSVPQMQADLAAVIQGFRAEMGAAVPVHLATLLPKSASVGGWTQADGGDQTVAAHFGPGSKAAKWNALIRSRAFGDFDVIDPQSLIQAGLAESFLWAGDGRTPKLFTADGGHPTSDGYDRIARGLPPP